MPSRKKKSSLMETLWVIYNPVTELYWKAVPNGHYNSWNRLPHIYTTEKKLMTGIAGLRRQGEKAEHMVIPFILDPSSALSVQGYGE